MEVGNHVWKLMEDSRQGVRRTWANIVPERLERMGRLGKLYWRQEEEGLAVVLILKVRERVNIRDSSKGNG